MKQKEFRQIREEFRKINVAVCIIGMFAFVTFIMVIIGMDYSTQTELEQGHWECQGEEVTHYFNSRGDDITPFFERQKLWVDANSMPFEIETRRYCWDKLYWVQGPSLRAIEVKQ